MAVINLAQAIRLGTQSVRSVFVGSHRLWSQPIYPLDDVGGEGPLWAYGMHKMRAAYDGPAIRVVRPSDSAEQDIGFVGQEFDSAALLLFLGSELGRVSVRYDQTGNANHETQTVPASRPHIGIAKINGHVTVHYEGGFMNMPPALSTNSLAVDAYIVAELFTGSSNGAQVSMLELGSATNRATLFAYGTPWTLRGSTKPGSSTYPPQTRACLFEYRLAAAETSMSMADETTASTALTNFTMTGGFSGFSGIAANMNKMYQSASVGYARTLTAGDRAALRASLRGLYGIPEPGAVRVFFDGDSITAAADSTGAVLQRYGYPKQAVQMFGKAAHVYNFAKSGTQIHTILSTDYATHTGYALSKYPTGTRVVFIMIGTNDLTLGSRSAAQIYADIQTYCGNVRATGAKVVVATILPNRVWNGTQQATRNTLNTSLRTNWASFADGLADFAADPVVGPQSAADDMTLYPDGLHPSLLGHTYLAPIAAAAINALL